MNMFFCAILNLVQTVLSVVVIGWAIALFALLGQSIIDVSNHEYAMAAVLILFVIGSPFLFKVVGKSWEMCASWKRQLAQA